MHWRHTVIALVLFAFAAAAAEAQTAPPTPRNDTTLAVGWFGSQYPDFERYDRWQQSLSASAALGHYWNDHFKTEVEAAWLSRVHFDSYRSVVFSDGTAYVRSQYRFQDAKLSFGQLYQFAERAWVHPYVGAGVDIDFLRSAEERPAQVVSVYSPFTPGSPSTSRPVELPKLSERGTTVRGQPFVKGGFKIYTSDRLFIATEGKFGLGDGPELEYAVWKTGVGIDF